MDKVKLFAHGNVKKRLEDMRAPNSNYMPFNVPIGKASDYPDTKEGRAKMMQKLLEIRKENNPVNIKTEYKKKKAESNKGKDIKSNRNAFNTIYAGDVEAITDFLEARKK